jgi:beta-galactosidase
MVVIPATNLIGQTCAERLTTYVRGGGTLVVTARSGFKDDTGKVPGPAPGYLAGILGVVVEEIDSQPPDQMNQVRFVQGPVGKASARHWFEILQPTLSQPLAVYESDYYAGRPAATIRRLDQGQAIYLGVLADVDLYAALFDWLLPSMEIKSVLNTPPGVEAKLRVGPAGQVLFLLNHNTTPAIVSIGEDYLDVLAQAPACRRVELEPYGVSILHQAH